MKKLRTLPIILILCLVAAALSPAALAAESTPQAPNIKASAAVAVDLDSGRVLYGLDQDKQINPASLTKIMTVLLAVEAVERGDIKESDMVTATDACFAGLTEDSMTAGILSGEIMSVHDLIYCAMLSSANEACNILAIHISGSVSGFVELMNERAAELGCTNTCFKNTHGLTTEGHYTTAADLAVIMTEALGHELFYEVCTTVEYVTTATNLSLARTLKNSNALINSGSIYGDNYVYEYAKGGKTGYTDLAGFCLASFAEKDGVRVLCIVLGCPGGQTGSGYTVGSFPSSAALYDWVFDNFSKRTIITAKDTVGETAVALGRDASSVSLRPIADVVALVPSSMDLTGLEKEISLYSDTATAPVKAGEELGRLTLKDSDGTVYGSVRLVAASSVSVDVGDFIKNGVGEFVGYTWVRIALIAIAAILVFYIVIVINYRKKHKKAMAAQSVAGAPAAAKPVREKKPGTEEKSVKKKAAALIKTAKGPAAQQKTEREKRDYYEEFFAEEHKKNNGK